jgi:two-component system chemotaxis response regulator CheB
MNEAKTLIEATCPDCRGPLSELRDGAFAEYSCLVGHRYSPRALLAAHSEAQEKALWAAVVALEESANLAHRLAPRFKEETGNRLREQGNRRVEKAAIIREIASGLEPFVTE